MEAHDEDRLAEQIEADAGESDAWVDDPAPPSARRGALGAQVTVRFTPEVAEQLRRVAAARQIGYTQLVRTWVEECLRRAIDNESASIADLMESLRASVEAVTLEMHRREAETHRGDAA